MYLVYKLHDLVPSTALLKARQVIEERNLEKMLVFRQNEKVLLQLV